MTPAQFWKFYVWLSLGSFIVLTVACRQFDVGLFGWLSALATYWATQFWFVRTAFSDYMRDTDGRR